jgi:hypothetical protein
MTAVPAALAIKFRASGGPLGARGRGNGRFIQAGC